jgi:hypothetical protein
VPADLVLRFMWTLTLIPDDTEDGPVAYDFLVAVGPFLALFEVCRRLGWCLLRVENEFVSGSNNHTRVDFVPMHGEEGDSKMEEEEKEERKDGKDLIWEIGIVGGGIVVISSMAYFAPG